MFNLSHSILAVLFLWAILLSGCATNQPTTESKPSDTKMQTLGDKQSKRKVVERDGKYYEVWEQHERLCSDCDR